jgi:hypothetical protein
MEGTEGEGTEGALAFEVALCTTLTDETLGRSTGTEGTEGREETRRNRGTETSRV